MLKSSVLGRAMAHNTEVMGNLHFKHRSFRIPCIDNDLKLNDLLFKPLTLNKYHELPSASYSKVSISISKLPSCLKQNRVPLHKSWSISLLWNK